MTQTASISPWQAWMLAARPKTLPAAVSPVLVGTALAVRDGAFRPLPALAAMLGALLLQIGVNLANDYFDYVRGIDTHERKGPARVTQSGLIPPARVRLAMILIFALATLIGVYLILAGGAPILAIGVASILSALAYSGGPFPLASHGLGDLFVFIFFGLCAVGGTYWVQAKMFSPLIILAAVPMGLLITAILVVNNYRDIDSDRKAGKRTLAVMLGRRGARIEYVLLLAVSYLAPLLLWLGYDLSPIVLLPLVSLPLALPLIRTLFSTTEGPILNKTLAGTARLALVYSILFSIGLFLPVLIPRL